jgi:hypothetical protein
MDSIQDVFRERVPQDMGRHLLKPGTTGELAHDQLHAVGLQRLLCQCRRLVIGTTQRPGVQDMSAKSVHIIDARDMTDVALNHRSQNRVSLPSSHS